MFKKPNKQKTQKLYILHLKWSLIKFLITSNDSLTQTH